LREVQGTFHKLTKRGQQSKRYLRGQAPRETRNSGDWRCVRSQVRWESGTFKSLERCKKSGSTRRPVEREGQGRSKLLQKPSHPPTTQTQSSDWPHQPESAWATYSKQDSIQPTRKTLTYQQEKNPKYYRAVCRLCTSRLGISDEYNANTEIPILIIQAKRLAAGPERVRDVYWSSLFLWYCT
jgi:hypothetical protein